MMIKRQMGISVVNRLSRELLFEFLNKEKNDYKVELMFGKTGSFFNITFFNNNGDVESKFVSIGETVVMYDGGFDIIPGMSKDLFDDKECKILCCPLNNFEECKESKCVAYNDNYNTCSILALTSVLGVFEELKKISVSLKEISGNLEKY